MCLVTVYYVLEHWNYPLKNILGELGCHIANLLRQTGSLQIQFHSFIMATTRYIFLFHDNLLLRFNLTTKVSAITYFENSTIVAIKKIYCHFSSCQINKSDIWLQFEKNFKNPPDGADMQKNQKQILKLLYLHY